MAISNRLIGRGNYSQLRLKLMEMLVLMYSKQKIISIIFYPFFLVYKWIIDIGKTLHAHDGWKLLVNLIAGIFIFLGIWQTWLTYTASHHTALTQKLEKNTMI